MKFYLGAWHHAIGHVLTEVASGNLAQKKKTVFLLGPVNTELPHQLKVKRKLRSREPGETAPTDRQGL